MRLNRLLKSAWGALALAAACAVSEPARADGLALDRFDPAPAGDRMFGVQSPFAAGHLTPHAMVLLDYAHNPLVLHTKNDDKPLGAVVSNQLFLHLNGSIAFWNRLNLNLDVPVALLQSGDSPTAGGQTFPSPDKAQFGDLRLGARVRLFGEYHDIFQLAIGGYLWLPTAPSGGFVGTGKVRGRPEAIIGGSHDRFVWTFAVGPEFRSEAPITTVAQGTMIRWGGGFGFLLLENRHLQIGPEVSGAVTLDQVQTRSVNLEVLFDARYRVVDDFEIGLGVGPGLTSGVGTPDFRGVLSLAYTPEQHREPPDRDKDGIPDAKDACPDVPGVPSTDLAKHGCPLLDRDHDGILDADDACPDEPGIRSEDPKKNGCPLRDRDKDGIVDDLDACPDEPGVASEDPKKNGCPPDRDGDGIIDAKDACPDVKGVADPDPAKNGCPGDKDGDGIRDDKDACPEQKGPADPDPSKNGCPTVRVFAGEIVILQQVQFDTAKATIKKVSDPLLDQVAQVMREHPEIVKIEVQGHTDSKGNAQGNLRLSQDRADSVRKALIKRKIDGARLTAKGYGQTVPIADNDTDEGRQKNRRVQFKIIEKRVSLEEGK